MCTVPYNVTIYARKPGGFVISVSQERAKYRTCATKRVILVGLGTNRCVSARIHEHWFAGLAEPWLGVRASSCPQNSNMGIAR